MNFHSKVTFITESVYLLVFAVAPGQSLIWGKPPNPSSSPAHMMSTKTLCRLTNTFTELQWISKAGFSSADMLFPNRICLSRDSRQTHWSAFVRIPSTAPSQLLESKLLESTYSFSKLKTKQKQHTHTTKKPNTSTHTQKKNNHQDTTNNKTNKKNPTNFLIILSH